MIKLVEDAGLLFLLGCMHASIYEASGSAYVDVYMSPSSTRILVGRIQGSRGILVSVSLGLLSKENLTSCMPVSETS